MHIPFPEKTEANIVPMKSGLSVRKRRLLQSKVLIGIGNRSCDWFYDCVISAEHFCTSTYVFLQFAHHFVYWLQFSTTDWWSVSFLDIYVLQTRPVFSCMLRLIYEL